MSDPNPITAFVAVSAVLTGIDAGKLSPQLDPVDLKTLYYTYAVGQDPVSMKTLLDVFAANAGKTPEQIAAAIFASPVVWYARSIILEWYLGSWYPPAALALYAADNTRTPGSTVISSKAYTNGWAWNIAQAHPMGYSNLRFGYWESPPPALSAYVGGK